MNRQNKSELFQMRIDVGTKRALQLAAADAGMSASALALRAIKDLLREGETHVILPDHLRVTRTEKEMWLERARASWKVWEKERRQEQRERSRLRALKRANLRS